MMTDPPLLPTRISLKVAYFMNDDWFPLIFTNQKLTENFKFEI